jgi:hypothetical protein
MRTLDYYSLQVLEAWKVFRSAPFCIAAIVDFVISNDVAR